MYHHCMTFLCLVDAFLNKTARLLVTRFFFFFEDRLEATNVNVQLKKLNEYPGNASKLFQRVPPLVFYFLNVTYKTGRD